VVFAVCVNNVLLRGNADPAGVSKHLVRRRACSAGRDVLSSCVGSDVWQC
jgi:hypothetical protein